MEVTPGYKQTEVGVIPEEWEVYVLDEISERISVGLATSVTKHYRGSGVPIVRNLNIKDGFFDGSDMLFINPEFANANASKAARAFDVLTVHTGSNLGQTCVLPLEFDNCQTFTTLITTPKKRIADPYFLCLHMSSEFGRNEMARLEGGGGKGNLNTGELKKYRIALPPRLTEQQAIAEALSDVDGLLGGLDRLLAKKRDLKQAAMQQLLTGQKRLPGFQGEWEKVQVQDVITGFFCGPSPTCEERNIQDDVEWGVLKTTAATKENGWDWTKHKTLPRVFWNKPHLELKKGDVIVTKAGPRHRVGVTAWVDYVPPRIIVSGKMIGLRPRPDKVVPLMLAAAISARGAQVFLDQRTTGMAESQVNFENIALLETPIRIPRIKEQTAIAEVLSDMDAELAALEQRREKTRALKQAMMQELLTGRVRLM